MTVRKNPDWHVWVGDALYWIRTPPGIYIFVIFILGVGLTISLHSPTLPPTHSVPVYVNPSPSPPPQQIVPTPAPPAIPTERCPAGTIFVQHLASCIPGHRRTTDIFVAGTKNNCPDDAIFIDHLGGCIPMYSAGNYTLFAGNLFTISSRRTAYVYVRSGQIQICNPFVHFNRIVGPGDPPIIIHVGAIITGIADGSSIRVEFDAAPH
jgi:hypothetical protein